MRKSVYVASVSQFQPCKSTALHAISFGPSFILSQEYQDCSTVCLASHQP